MPVYVYKCQDKKCAEVKEFHFSMTDNPEVICQKCGTVMERVPQIASISYKCGGFHCTDYPSR